jgi:hypothetical protein
MRRDWCDWSPNVAIVKFVDSEIFSPSGLPIIAGYRKDNYVAMWAANPKNTRWCKAPNAVERMRAPIVKSLKREWAKAA